MWREIKFRESLFLSLYKRTWMMHLWIIKNTHPNILNQPKWEKVISLFFFFFPQHSSPECSGIILVYSYLKVERNRCLLLVLDCFFSYTWFSHYFSVYTEDEGVLLQCLKNSVQPLLFVWKLVEYRSTIQTSLIWFGLDQMSTNWNLMLLRQMTM